MTEATLTRATPLRHSPPLDGLRGVFVLLILLVHSAYFNFESLAVTVDGFFVTSGFLITTLLLEEHRRTGTLNTKSFYVRRAFRLFPSMYTVIVTTLLLGLAFASDDLRRKCIEDAAAAATYMYHVFFPVAKEIQHGVGPEVRPLIQLWSLTVEEHFYVLAFPMILYIIRFRAARLAIVGLLSAWLAIGIARAMGYVGPLFAWYQRPDALMLGVAVGLLHAIAPTELSAHANRWIKRAGILAVAVLGFLVFIGTKLAPYRIYHPVNPLNGARLHDAWYWGRFGFTLGQICLGVIVIVVVRQPTGWFANVLSPKWLQAVGVRSYCIYLVHVPLAVLLEDVLHEKLPIGVILMIYVAALPVVSELLHRKVEQPGIRLRRRFTNL